MTDRELRHQRREQVRQQQALIDILVDDDTDDDDDDAIMGTEQHQLNKIIDSIPTFSGNASENVSEWVQTISLKFELLGYNAEACRRYVPQYLAHNALTWHVANRANHGDWPTFTAAIQRAFPLLPLVSRDMNLKMLKDRRQGPDESFSVFYADVIKLCRQHDPQMTELLMVDWLKQGMKVALLDNFKGQDIARAQDLLERALRLELDQQVIDARVAEATQPPNPNFGSSCFASTTGQPYAPVRSNYAPPADRSAYLQQPLLPPTPRPSYPRQPSSTDRNTYGPRQPFEAQLCYECGNPGHFGRDCALRRRRLNQ
jgi:zinc knuckle protein